MAGRWWRWTKVLLSGAALLAVLGQALVFWLQNPRTRASLARFVAEKLGQSLGEPVAVAEAHVQLYPLQLSLRGVRVGTPPHPAVEIQSAQVNLGRLRLRDREVSLNLLRVKGLKVSTQAIGAGGEGSGKSPLRLSVRQMVVEGATIDRLKVAEGLALSVKDLNLMVTGRPERGFQGAFLRAGEVSLEGSGMLPLSGALQAWGQVFPEKAVLRRILVHAPGLSADLAGELAWGEQFAVKLDGTVRGELELVDETFGINADLAGAVAATTRIRVSKGGFSVDAQVVCPEVHAAGFQVAEVVGEVHVSPEGVEASLESGTFAGGVVEGSYQLADFGPSFNHRVALRGHGVEVDRFLEFLGVGRGGLASRASISADLSWEGAAIGAGRGVAVVRLSPWEGGIPVSGQLVVSLRGDGALHFEAPVLALGGGVVGWSGSLRLGSWAPRWSVTSPGVPLEAVAQLLAGWVGHPVLPEGLSGTAVFDLAIGGTFHDLEVAGSVALSPVCLGPLEADALESQLNLGKGLVRFADGQLVLGRGTVRFAGELELLEPSPVVRLRYAGRGLPLSRIASWAGLRFPLEGTGEVSGRLEGTLAHPELTADLVFSGVSVVGLPLGDGEARAVLEHDLLRVEPLSLGGISGSLEVDFASRHAAVVTRVRGLGLEPLSPVLARLLGGQVEAEFVGEFPWEAPAGRLTLRSAEGVEGTVTLSPQGLEAFLRRRDHWSFSAVIKQQRRGFTGSAKLSVASLSRLMKDLLGNEVPLDGELAADMELVLGASGPPALSGTITRAVLVAEGERVELTQPAPFTLQGLRFELPGLDLAGPSARLFLRGSRHPDGTLAANIAASAPASLLALAWREAAPRGRLEVLGELSGTDTAPRLDGVVRVQNGSLRVPGLPAPVTGIDGLAELVGDVITLRKVRFAFHGGTGLCSGQIRLWPSLDLDLGLELSAVRWPLAAGFEPALDGSLRLAGDLASLQLSGALQLRRSVYRRDVNLQRLVWEELLARERAAPAGHGLVGFDVRIAVPSTLEVHTPLARVVAQGELRLVGDSTQPGLLGQLDLLPGGELVLSGVVYEVERASVRFVDPGSIKPVIDLQARGVVQNFTVTVGLSGTLDRLVPTLASDPPLPEGDILALLALGVAPSSGGAAATSASAVASSFLTEQLTGAVTRRTRTLLALDQLRLDPFVSTEAGNPTARVTMVKQLSPDWSVTVSTNLSSNREEVLQSRWRVGKDIYLEATRDTDGSYSLEVKWRRRY